MKFTKLPGNHSRVVFQFDAAAHATHRRLVSRLAEGDAEAMQLFYAEFSPRVHGIVRRMLEDAEDAREAVQDTFIKVWSQASSYRSDRGEVVAWLVFIARNSAIDQVRKGARRRRMHETLRSFPTETEYPAPEQPESIAHHLIQLSIPQRQALELAFFSDFTQSEIAKALRMPVGNVKNHLRRGLAKLKQIVARHE